MPTVAELKKTLGEFGLSTHGRKAELQQRLDDHLSSAAAVPTRRTGPKSFHRALEARKRAESPRKTAGMATASANPSSRKKARRSSPKRAPRAAPSSTRDADKSELMQLTRAHIEESLAQSGKSGKQGTTFVTKAKSGNEYALKMFKKNRSAARTRLEAELQQLAADQGVTPHVLGVNTKENYIIMEKMEETIVDVLKRRHSPAATERSLTSAEERRIIEIAEGLDRAGVIQNDGNPLNLMVNKSGKLYVIDFGLAKKVTSTHKKKWGPEPNIGLALWDFRRNLRKYRVKSTPLITERLDEYKASRSR